MRNTSDLNRVANFLNHGWIVSQKRVRDNPEIEQKISVLREELKNDLRPVLFSKIPEEALGNIYKKSIAVPPTIDVTADGEVVGFLSLMEGRVKPGITTLQFVVNGQSFGHLQIDYNRSPLEEYRAALYKTVWNAIFNKTIGKLKLCPRCRRYFLNKAPRQRYCSANCTAEVNREQARRRVKKWRKQNE
jgi:hypothetical protein